MNKLKRLAYKRWIVGGSFVVAALAGLRWFYTCVWTTLSTDDIEQAKAFGEIFTGVLALVGLAVLIWRTSLLEQQANTAARQADLVERGQVTDRFTKAIDQLGDERLAVKLGGIYSLERIAKDSEQDRATIAEVLSAFVRNAEPPPTSEEEDHPGPPNLRPEAQAAITVLTDEGRDNGLASLALDLRRANLERANLRRANLQGAHLEGASLEGAHLEGANLQGARLRRAHLEGANLEGANLVRANLRRANLQGAYLGGAYLEWAFLERTNLSAAKLDEVVNLAKLHAFGPSKVRQLQIDSAYGDERTQLPEGLTRPESWVSESSSGGA